jgi:thioredoxin 1
MAEYQITKGNNELLNIADTHRDDIIMLDFYADWCGPCKAIAPKAHGLFKEYANKAGCRRLVLCKVNVDEDDNQGLCSAYKVRAMPTFVWISNMKVVNRLEGADSAILEKTTADLCIPRS